MFRPSTNENLRLLCFCIATLSAYALGFAFVSYKTALVLSLYSAITPPLILAACFALLRKNRSKSARRIMVLCLFVTLVTRTLEGGAQRSAVDRAKDLFVRHCSDCHLVSGEGDPGVEKLKGIKMLHLGSPGVQGLSDDAIWDRTSKGCGKMDAVPNLKREDLNQILGFLRTLKPKDPNAKTTARPCKPRK